jgi:transcriptional regulator with XRE-family HTH domain
MTERSASIPEKLDHLFKTVRRPDGREFTYDQVEKGTSGAVSRSYVWKLRNGRNENPSLEVIEALARFFEVPVTYFFEGVDVPSQDAVAVANLLRNPALRRLAERAQGLSPEHLELVGDFIEGLKRLET